MKVKKISPEQFDCTVTAMRPFGCMELWAGNEKAHRSLNLAGLESDVIAVPSGGEKGGDLSAVFSCSDNIARVILADCLSLSCFRIFLVRYSKECISTVAIQASWKTT